MEVPISTLYKRALEKASQASSLPTIQDETQVCIACVRGLI